MTMKLTQKETSLLQDQQNHEKICIQKYQAYASQAQAPQLKQLFNSFAQQEEQHLNTINQILNGQVPAMASQQGQQSQQSAQSNQQPTAQSAAQGTTNSQTDSVLCNDMLMTEKFVSGAYDTAIFEFSNPSVRQALNHIQKEEQEHGQGLFQYMQNNGMYNPK